MLVELASDPPPQRAVARDEALADQVAAGERAPTVRIWTSGRALVVPKWRLREISDCEILDRHGEAWPLCGRGSGGGVVAHCPGTLNLSLIMPAQSAMALSIDDAYSLWIDVLGEALRHTYRIQISASETDGAFCKGRYDAAVGGRKLAGTAQMRRRGSIVVHGTVLVDVLAIEYLELLAQAEVACGAKEYAHDPSRITSLREVTHQRACVPDLARALREAVSRLSSGTLGARLKPPMVSER